MQHRARWSGEELHVTSTVLGDAVKMLPSFRRTPLAADLRLASGGVRGRFASWLHNGGSPVAHRYLDAVLLTPRSVGEAEIPIAVVSRQYTLIPHRELVDTLLAAVSEQIPGAGGLACDVALSEYGGRMKLRVHLPPAFAPPDGEAIQPTIECLNSVDRSRPLQVYLGWFRLVCSNALIIGQEFARMHRRHVGTLELEDVHTAVSTALERLTRDADVLQSWWSTPVAGQTLRKWVDGPIAESWGVHAAARVLHIAGTGYDCRVHGRGRVPASRRQVERTEPVPGSATPNDNAYRLSQVLAFLAGKWNEVERMQQRLCEIPLLMSHIPGLPCGSS